MNTSSLANMSVGWSILVAGIFSATCATVPPGIEPPKISIANIAPKDVAFFEQRFDVQLRIQNPNEKELSLTGMRFEIDLNEKEFCLRHDRGEGDRASLWLTGRQRRGHHRPQRVSLVRYRN